MGAMNSALVKQTIQGFQEVNRITNMVRRARLENLTDFDARLEFEQFYLKTSLIFQEKLPCFDEREIEHQLRFRNAVTKLAQKWGYESTV